MSTDELLAEALRLTRVDRARWASCWEGCDDDKHRAVVDFLISRGARHHIFSAVAMNLPDEVRRIVSADPAALNQRQSRNENHRTPLHFAVALNRPEMVNLLLELGADPLAIDGGGMPVAVYATDCEIDVPVVRALLNAGADPKTRDSKHDGDALGCAELFKKREIVQLLRDRTAGE